MLIESFFEAQRDCKEDISKHVAKLQKLCRPKQRINEAQWKYAV